MTHTAHLVLALLAQLSGGTATVSGVAASAPACEITGATESAADVSRATRACESARSGFRELFGDPVPEVQVILSEEPGYRTGMLGVRAVVQWPTARALARSGGAGGDGPYGAEPWDEVLPHEIAHVLLAARFFTAGNAFEGYGTPFPDWLDEAVAIWAEPLASRGARLDEARRLPEARHRLDAILAARHPAASDPSVLAMRDGAPPPADDDELVAFYPQAIALLAFVHEQGGRTAVLALAERLLQRGRTEGDLLVGLPGLPGDVGTVEAVWRRWLAG